ncbi:unnamed protein product, partial [marine sediment metagenome]
FRKFSTPDTNQQEKAVKLNCPFGQREYKNPSTYG